MRPHPATRIKPFSVLRNSVRILANCKKMRLWAVAALVAVGVCSACGESSALEEQLRVLSKQVTTLLDRRREDLASIADDLRRKVLSSAELGDVRDEMQKLR